MDSDPGEGTSDGRVTQNQKLEEAKIKQEAIVKDEPSDVIDLVEHSRQPQSIHFNEDDIKSENDSESDIELFYEGDDEYVKKEIEDDGECLKKKSNSSKNKGSKDNAKSGKNPKSNEPIPKKHGKRAKNKRRTIREQNTKKKGATKEQSKIHKCNLCSYSTSHKGVLNRHIRMHSGDKPFECEICFKAFTRKSDLKRHQSQIHGAKFPFHCSKCRRGFADEMNKIEHKIECNFRQYECYLCQYSASQLAHLKSHMIYRHTSEDHFQCRICFKRFANEQNRDRHSRTHLNELPFECSKCGRRFAGENEKQLHQDQCNGRRYECHLCKKSILNKNNSEYHMKSNHTGERSLQCANCYKKFIQKSSLKQHLKTHAKQRPIRCSKCWKKFTVIDKKKEHEAKCHRRHYQCYLCKAEMKIISFLKDHVRAHHTGEKPIQCKKCDTRFAYRNNLISHMKRNH